MYKNKLMFILTFVLLLFFIETLSKFNNEAAYLF